MSAKTIVMIGMTIGSIIGGYVPIFFGASALSFSSIIGNAIGGFVGIYFTYKFTQN